MDLFSFTHSVNENPRHDFHAQFDIHSPLMHLTYRGHTLLTPSSSLEKASSNINWLSVCMMKWEKPIYEMIVLQTTLFERMYQFHKRSIPKLLPH